MGDVAKFSTNKHLTICGKIELTMAAIYKHWSRESDHDPELKALWNRMMNEEEEHYQQVELLRRLNRGNDIGRKILTDGQIERFLMYAEECLRQVLGKVTSEHDALLLAIHLEDTFMEFHASEIFRCEDEQVGSMFRVLSKNDEEHLEILKETYRERYPSDPQVYSRAC